LVSLLFFSLLPSPPLFYTLSLHDALPIFVKRFASLGIALALAVGTLVPTAQAAPDGKTVVLGFSQEPDTFVAGEGGLYVTQEVYNLVYSQLVVIDDLMRPIPDLAVSVPTLDNGDAVM